MDDIPHTLIDAIAKALPDSPVQTHVKVQTEIRDFMAQKFLVFTSGKDAAVADAAMKLWKAIIAVKP